MKYLSHFITVLKNHQSNRKLLDKPKRTLQKFQQKYPHYKMGTNNYGIPVIRFKHPDAILTIGNFCSIANHVEIFLGGNHRADWVSSYPFPAFYSQAKHIQNYVTTHGDVTIGSDVWLCQNATILSGVTIGHGAVVANGAIVTKDVASYEIVGGNPAKHIRWRFDESIREALLASAWWDWPEEEVLSVVDLICSDDIGKFLEYVNNRKAL
jgi:chloramphenicol O-acetyltransferase type B